MAATKYELRSNDVQEVMNRPPHLFISWGNTGIVLSIVIALLILNHVQLPVRQQLPAIFQYTGIPDGHRNDSGGLMIFSLNTTLPGNIRPGNTATVDLDGTNMQTMGNIPASVDSVWSVREVTYMALHTAGHNGLITTSAGKSVIPPKGLPVLLVVVTGKMKVFPFLLSSLFRH
jgi:hypothetical protein